MSTSTSTTSAGSAATVAAQEQTTQNAAMNRTSAAAMTNRIACSRNRRNACRRGNCPPSSQLTGSTAQHEPANADDGLLKQRNRLDELFWKLNQPTVGARNDAFEQAANVNDGGIANHNDGNNNDIANHIDNGNGNGNNTENGTDDDRDVVISQINDILTAHPDILAMPNEFGNLPFHSACQWGCPLEIVRRLFDLHPKAIAIATTSNGRLPLHLVCTVPIALFSWEVMRFVIAMHPEARTCRDADGCLPLHLLCQRKSLPPPGCLHLLVNGCPETLLERAGMRFLPLTMTIRYANIDSNCRQLQKEMRRFVLQHARQMYRQSRALAAKRSSGKAVFDQTSSNRSSISIDAGADHTHDEQASTDAKTGASSDPFIRNLRRWFLAYCWDIHMVRMFLEEWKGFCYEDLGGGQLPIHVMCTMRPHVNVVQLMIRKAPKTILWQDEQGFTPLHQLLSQSSPNISIVRLLCTSATTMLHSQSAVARFSCPPSGPTSSPHKPASSVTKMKNASKPTVCPNDSSLLLRIQDTRGRTPLHMACQNHPSIQWNIIDCLLQRFPDSIHILDESGLTPFLLSCTLDRRLETIFDLLCYDPSRIIQRL